MTKNIEYDVSIIELLTLIKRRWKTISAIALVGVLLCGGYGIISNSGEPTEIKPDGNYDRDMAYYTFLEETEQDLSTTFKEDWERICYERINNPVFSIDPFNCKYELIVLQFDPAEGNHDKTVKNWIFKADNQRLFGSQTSSLSDYKSSLIVVDRASETETESAETAVQLFEVEDFDVGQAADYLVSFFKQCATKENVNIKRISKASDKGYNEYVLNYQQLNRSAYNSISSCFQNSASLKSSINRPQDLQQDEGNKFKDIIRNCLVGLALGLIVGIALILFNVIRKHELVSSRQIEETFGLELLSDCSSNNETAIDILNANLDVLTGENNNIAVIADNKIAGIAEIVSSWTDKSNRSFTLCTDIFDNAAMIEALRTTNGIVIGAKLGTSKLEQIHRVIIRANKLNLKVLGYVLL